jgi:hypothetical protein
VLEHGEGNMGFVHATTNSCLAPTPHSSKVGTLFDEEVFYSQSLPTQFALAFHPPK